MKFTGDPQFDAYNYYKDQKNKGGINQVHVFRNGECYIKLRNGDEFCSFVDFKNDSNCSCFVKVEHKYRRYAQWIFNLIEMTKIGSCTLLDNGILVESKDKDLVPFVRQIQEIAYAVKDRICASIR